MTEYIKREAAIKAIEKADYTLIANDADSCKADYLREIIESVPSSDVAPVVHGRWDESKEHFYLMNGCKEWINFYCSECDAPNNSPTDYCPNCGAKMDGGEDKG